MAVEPASARRLQRERPVLLYDTHGDERDDLAATHPDIVARLDAFLQAPTT